MVPWLYTIQAYDRGISSARHWLSLDILNEEAHRDLMRCYAWSGQHGAALRQYRECVRILKQELGVSPVAETTRLYREIMENRLPAQAGKTGGFGQSSHQYSKAESIERAEIPW
jgi:DNA-binding SARP family transcriptional activator